MPSVELIAVGTELLLGQLLDTNTAHVAQRLAENGIDVRATHAIGDNRERIAAAIRSALDRSDGVVTTGGLGPTVDDLTKEAVCDALGVGTELYEPALRQMEAFFTQIGRTMRPNNRKQAELPAGGTPLPNPVGTAPGFVAFDARGKFVACMPGVPREMKPMLSERLLPLLRERFALGSAIYTRVIHTINVGESEIDHRIDDLFRAGENPKIAVLAHDYRADVKIMAKAATGAEAEASIGPVQREIERRLEGFVFGTDETTIEAAILCALESRGEKVAVAESCTGGRIAAALTSVPGASKSFVGGVVAYDNAVKVSELSVDPATIAREGAVSETVALEMAQGARRRFGADVALATTGIAGPGGGSAEKPVGLVWIALDSSEGPQAWRFLLRGDRNAIQSRATTAGLGIMWRRCVGKERSPA
ncbi:MAG: competence/damage-inducible protein A [Candidatus Eremiobacteraeota bacterium]|nr:competence/damage-inducible protein A [Candidatus Eremiobacteraeota bacterium]MBV8721607.1 competence/damage-inducible protein A [Candidatus Eremiobacteraeota bacterium]